MFADSLDALHANSSKTNMCLLGSSELEASSAGGFDHLIDLQVLVEV